MTHPPAPFRLCVYCGSRSGDSPVFEAAAHAVGTALARRGWGLVYGGGRVGLMGVVADAALAAGAPVTGVIPEKLVRREVAHPGLTTLTVVATMHERKQRMAEQADAFLALPGGLGTLEELFEVWTWRQLGYHRRRIGLLNVAGYYDPLNTLLGQMQAAGFIDAAQRAHVCLHTAVEPLLDTLALPDEAPDAPSGTRLDLSRT